MSSSKARFLSILAKDITTVGKVPSTNIVLPASGVTAATYGSATQIPVLTIDTEGRVTSASTTSVAGVSSFGYNTGSGRLTINTADGGSFTADVTLAPFTTTTLAEGTNQYFTTARARSSISATGTNLGYNSTTGVLSYTQGNTDTVAEGATNLYYTSARARDAISYTTGSAGYNSTSGQITIPGSSTDITEGTKLFYTDARARAALSGGTGVTYNSTTGVIAIGQPVATTDNVTFGNVTVNGILTSDDITSTNITVSGNATITGNLTVSGTTTTVNSTTVSVADINIEVARNATTAAQANGAGLTVTGPTTPATLTYSSADDRWNLNKDLNISRVYGNLTGAVTGNASTASTLQTARSITITGDGSWTVNFDGSANVSAGLILANSGVTAGTYGSGTAIPVLTIDAKGRVTTATTTSVTIGDGAMTVTAGAGLTGGGQVGTANQTGASSVTISHADTSSVADQAAATNTFVSGITFDTYGHVQTVTRSSPSGFLTAESDTLATVTARGATANTSITVNSTADGILTLNKSSGTNWGYLNFSYGGTRKFYFGINASGEPELGTDNSSLFRVIGGMTIGGGITIGNSTTAVSTADDYSSPLILKRSSNDGKGALLMQGSDSIGTAIEHGRSNSASHWGTYLAFLVHDDNVSDVVKSLKEKLRISGAGVGIGTSSPALGSGSYGLNIVNSSYTQLRLQSSASSAGIEFKPSTGNAWELQGTNSNTLIVYDRGQSLYRMSIASSGNVSIGWNNDSDQGYKLAVNGTGYASNDFRAPIFYDVNDTGYYGDFASTSVLNTLSLTGNINFGTTTTQSGPWVISPIGSGGATPATKGTGYGRNLIVKAGNSDNNAAYAGGDLYLRAGGPTAPSTTYGVVYLTDDGGYTQVGGSLRAPIYYDSADTTYYINANSSSNIVSLNLAGSGTSLALNGAGSNIAFRDQDLTWTGYVGFSGNTGQLNFPGRNIEITAGYNASVTISTGASGYNSGQVIIPWGRLEVQNGSIRSPIYYDYNNTAAWLDPSVTSGTILATGASSDTLGYNPSYGIYIGGINGRYVYSGNSSYTGPIFWNGSAAYTIYHSGNLPAEADTLASVTARGSSTSTSVTLSSNGNHYAGHLYYDAYDAAGNYYPHFLSGSDGTGGKINWRLGSGSGTYITHYWDKNDTQFVNNLKAPIFYDYNNTAYYVDPNGTSRLYELKVGGGPGGNTAGNLYIQGNYDWRWIAGYSPDYGVGNGFGFYSDTLGYYLMSVSTSGNWYFGQNNHNSSYRLSINGTGYASSDFRAPIFYDSDDTSYYTNPNGLSRLYRLQVIGDWAGSNPNEGAINIRGNYPSMTFRNAISNTMWLRHMDGSGDIQHYYATGGLDSSSWSIKHSMRGEGTFYSSSSMRSPIFYDSDDTTYYLDPNNTSTSAVLAGNISLNGVIVRRSAGTGYLSGNYSSSETTATTGAIYTIGGSYYPTSASLNNMYGIGYTYAGVAGGTASATSSSAWGLYVATNGTTRVFLDSDNGRVISSGDMRSPLYYDRDDTGYYTDPNSTSRMYRIDFNNLYYASDTNYGFIGTSVYADTLNSGYAGDQLEFNYVRGTWAGISHDSLRAPLYYDYNDTSYYLDPNSYSNVWRLNVQGNYSGDTSGSAIYIGGQNVSTSNSLWINFHSDGDAAYRIGKPAGAWTQPLEIRFYTGIRHRAHSAYGGHRFINYNSDSTRFSVADGDDNVRSIANFYAPIMYDYNDTGYYVDPNASTSLRTVGDWRANASTWTGEFSGKIQYHSNNWYFQAADQFIWRNSGGSNVVYGDQSGNHWAISSSRSPIFYDSDNTGYYLDPNGTSNLNVVQGQYITAAAASISSGYGGFGGTPSNGYMITTNIDYSTFNMPTVIIEGYAYGNQQTIHLEIVWYSYNDSFTNYSYTNLGAWDPGVVRIGTNGNGKVCIHLQNNIYYGRMNVRGIYDQGASRLLSWSVQQDVSYSGLSRVTTVGRSQIRSGVSTGDACYMPIMYDNDNSGYYVDPANYSYVNSLRAASYLASSGNIYTDGNYGYGLVGTYASTRYQGVYAMSDSYKLSADGTTTGNLYGMAWSHPNAGGVAGNLDSHGMIVMINGGFGSCMSYSIKASGNVTAYSDERLKTNWRDMPTDYVSKLAEVKVGIYDRTDGEQLTQVGVSAQSLQQVLPEAIITADDEIKTLSVNYGGAALASAVELAKKVVEQEERIKRLEALVETLINKLGE